MKKCKGINKAKNYSGCGKNPPFQAGLCYECYKYWLYNIKEGIEFRYKNQLKAKKVVEASQKKQANKEKKERRFELLTYAQRIQEARKVFQKWIRERDKDLPCVSCGTHYCEEWHGSHYKNANEYSELIFNEHNVNKSCLQCNKFKHGNKESYRVELVKRIGIEAVEALDNATPNKVFKYSNEQLKEIIKKYSNA